MYQKRRLQKNMELTFKQNFLEKYLATALVRHHAYLAKKQGLPKPWVDDPVFQNYFFCNVFRQYDKCSKWIIEKVVPLVDQDIRNWPLIILYRYISTYEVFKDIEEVGQISNISWVRSYLQNRRKEGGRIFNGCFIRNPRMKGGWAQTWEVPFYLINEMEEYETSEGTYPGNFLNELETLEDMTKWFTRFSGTKGFMGYEYACDFEYTKHFNPTDKLTWCNKGPGAQRGLSWVTYGLESKSFSQEEFLVRCRMLLEYLKEAFKRVFPNEEVTMREVEHWLCEFQKYIKYYVNSTRGTKCKYRKYDAR